jgi:hypothetical protein
MPLDPTTVLDEAKVLAAASEANGLPKCVGSAAGRHERLGGDHSRPFT